MKKRDAVLILFISSLLIGCGAKNDTVIQNDEISEETQTVEAEEVTSAETEYLEVDEEEDVSFDAIQVGASQDIILEKTGKEFVLPAEAEIVSAIYDESIQQAEIHFTLSGSDYTAKKRETGSCEDISGILYGDDYSESSKTIGGNEGMFMCSKYGNQFINVVIWYNQKDALSYALYKFSEEKDESILNIAEEMSK